MSQSHVVSNLVERRAALADEVVRLRERLDAATSDLIHIDATIHIVDPDFALSDIRLKGPTRNNPWFANGELSRFALDALRQATGPMSTRQLGEIMAARKGAKPKDGEDWDRLLKAVLGALQRFERRSVVRMIRGDAVGQRNIMLWQLI